MTNYEVLENLFRVLDINKQVKLAAQTEEQIKEVERFERVVEEQIKNTYIK